MRWSLLRTRCSPCGWLRRGGWRQKGRAGEAAARRYVSGRVAREGEVLEVGESQSGREIARDEAAKSSTGRRSSQSPARRSLRGGFPALVPTYMHDRAPVPSSGSSCFLSDPVSHQPRTRTCCPLDPAPCPAASTAIQARAEEARQRDQATRLAMQTSCPRISGFPLASDFVGTTGRSASSFRLATLTAKGMVGQAKGEKRLAKASRRVFWPHRVRHPARSDRRASGWRVSAGGAVVRG